MPSPPFFATCPCVFLPKWDSDESSGFKLHFYELHQECTQSPSSAIAQASAPPSQLAPLSGRGHNCWSYILTQPVVQAYWVLLPSGLLDRQDGKGHITCRGDPGYFKTKCSFWFQCVCVWGGLFGWLSLLCKVFNVKTGSLKPPYFEFEFVYEWGQPDFLKV